MSPMLYLHSWGVCLGFSIESSVHSGPQTFLNSESLMSSVHLVVVPWMSLSCHWNPGILAVEPSLSYVFILSVQGILLYHSRDSWDSAFGVTHSAQYCPVFFFLLCNLFHFLLHTLGMHMASRYYDPLQPHSLWRSLLSAELPMSLDHKTTFLEGNQIGPAGQVPHVNPGTPGQGSRSGED